MRPPPLGDRGVVAGQRGLWGRMRFARIWTTRTFCCNASQSIIINNTLSCFVSLDVFVGWPQMWAFGNRKIRIRFAI